MTEYVYFLQCSESPFRVTQALYIGFTHNYKNRFYQHSHNYSHYTAKFTKYEFCAVIKVDHAGLMIEKYFKKHRSQTRNICQYGLWTWGDEKYWSSVRGQSLKRKLLPMFQEYKMELVEWNPKAFIPLK